MTHPIPAALRDVSAALSSVAEVDPLYMCAGEKAEALLRIVSLEARVAELRLRLLASADDVANEAGARSAADWLAHRGRQRGSDMRADHRLALALDRERPVLAAALRAGEVNLAQARVIDRALGDLPSDVPAELVAKAEAELVRLAGEFDPTTLTRLGRRILEAVAPEVADEHEAKQLEELEKKARERQRLRLRSCGDGTTRISGLLPDPVAARLASYLDAYANPRRDTTGGGNAGAGGAGAADPLKRLPYPRRAAEAFGAFLEAVDPKRLPIHGGDATTVMVTIDLEALRSELGTAVLGATAPGDSVDRITASQARRLACNAQIVPAVLGGDSEVLDLGRSRRLFSRAQRKALLLRHSTCQAEGCNIPGAWSEAHHWLAWSEGGPTDVDNAALLCSIHHHRAHDPAYRADRLPNGDVRFVRRR